MSNLQKTPPSLFRQAESASGPEVTACRHRGCFASGSGHPSLPKPRRLRAKSGRELPNCRWSGAICRTEPVQIKGMDATPPCPTPKLEPAWPEGPCTAGPGASDKRAGCASTGGGCRWLLFPGGPLRGVPLQGQAKLAVTDVAEAEKAIRPIWTSAGARRHSLPRWRRPSSARQELPAACRGSRRYRAGSAAA